jgi:hypothetical protein
LSVISGGNEMEGGDSVSESESDKKDDKKANKFKMRQI